jgi:hypothetical protein
VVFLMYSRISPAELNFFMSPAIAGVTTAPAHPAAMTAARITSPRRTSRGKALRFMIYHGAFRSKAHQSGVNCEKNGSNEARWAGMGECCGSSDPQQEKNGVLLQNASAYFRLIAKRGVPVCRDGRMPMVKDPVQEQTAGLQPDPQGFSGSLFQR